MATLAGEAILSVSFLPSLSVEFDREGKNLTLRKHIVAFNPIALRMAKNPKSFGRSECSMVKYSHHFGRAWSSRKGLIKTWKIIDVYPYTLII